MTTTRIDLRSPAIAEASDLCQRLPRNAAAVCVCANLTLRQV
jgi:hypothetical protein